MEFLEEYKVGDKLLINFELNNSSNKMIPVVAYVTQPIYETGGTRYIGLMVPRVRSEPGSYWISRIIRKLTEEEYEVMRFQKTLG